MSRRKRRLQEQLVIALMLGSTLVVLSSLLLVLGTVVWRGLPALTLEMVT